MPWARSILKAYKVWAHKLITACTCSATDRLLVSVTPKTFMLVTRAMFSIVDGSCAADFRLSSTKIISAYLAGLTFTLLARDRNSTLSNSDCWLQLGSTDKPPLSVSHEARFFPRDSMHSANYAVARCPSVRLSVTRRYSIETAKHILKLFYRRVWQYLYGNPWRMRQMVAGASKIAIFDQYLALSPKRYKIESHSCYERRIGNHTQAFEWCHFQCPWVTPNLDFKVTTGPFSMPNNSKMTER